MIQRTINVPTLAFPRPLTIRALPPECLCTFVWAPRLSGHPHAPFVLKYAHNGCYGHNGRIKL